MKSNMSSISSSQRWSPKEPSTQERSNSKRARTYEDSGDEPSNDNSEHHSTPYSLDDYLLDFYTDCSGDEQDGPEKSPKQVDKLLAISKKRPSLSERMGTKGSRAEAIRRSEYNHQIQV